MLLRQKLIAVVGLSAIALAVVVGYSMPIFKANAKAKTEILTPADRLEELRASAESELFDIDFVDDATIDGEDQMELYSPSPFVEPFREQDPAFTDIADSVTDDKAFLQLIRNAPEESAHLTHTITTKDILYDHPYRGSRAVARSLLRRAAMSADQGDVTGMLENLDLTKTFLRTQLEYGETPAVITYFAVESDIAELLFQELKKPTATAESIASIDKFLAESTYSGDVFDVFTRNIQELITATRSIDSFTENEILAINAEQRNIEPPVQHPRIKEAMEAELIDLWIAMRAEAAKYDNNEMAGIMVDSALLKAMEDKSDGKYMIRTFGAIYEQVGRNLFRISQAKQALRAVAYIEAQKKQGLPIPQQLPEGIRTGTFGRDAVTLEFEVDNSGYKIMAKSPSKDRAEFFNHAFEINQLGGVVATVPHNP